MSQRRRLKQSTTLKERLTRWAEDVRRQALKLPPGVERDSLLKKARQADTASLLDDWANSPALQPPK
jgi:hypothetical protein